MLSVYMLPFILRPLDFLFNAKHYIFGFLSYMLLMPMFTNAFQIYAMCNLHDISWGNRPSTTGADQLTADKKAQVNIEIDYKVFRSNFVIFWIASNLVYFVFIQQIVNGQDPGTTFGYLEVFSCVLAFLVLFRFIFASIYIIGWKSRYCCFKNYDVKEKDLDGEIRSMKRESEKNGDDASSDDNEIE